MVPSGSYTRGRVPYLGCASSPHKLSKYRASAGAVAVPPPYPPVRAVRKNRSVVPLVQVPLVAHRIAPVLELKDAFLLSTSWCLICLIFEHICDNRINVGWTCHTLDRGADTRAIPFVLELLWGVLYISTSFIYGRFKDWFNVSWFQNSLLWRWVEGRRIVRSWRWALTIESFGMDNWTIGRNKSITSLT